MGMIRAFQKIDAAELASSEALAGDIGLSIWTTIVGLGMMPVGVIFLVCGIIRLVKVNRQRCRPGPPI